MLTALALTVTIAATLLYASTLAVGTLSARGRTIARVWHTSLFVASLSATLLAIGGALLAAASEGSAHWLVAVCLAAAAAPLAILPQLARPAAAGLVRHAAVGLSAAPGYVAAFVVWALVK